MLAPMSAPSAPARCYLLVDASAKPYRSVPAMPPTTSTIPTRAQSRAAQLAGLDLDLQAREPEIEAHRPAQPSLPPPTFPPQRPRSNDATKDACAR
jgi:hypothetical protein